MQQQRRNFLKSMAAGLAALVGLKALPAAAPVVNGPFVGELADDVGSVGVCCHPDSRFVVVRSSGVFLLGKAYEDIPSGSLVSFDENGVVRRYPGNFHGVRVG